MTQEQIDAIKARVEAATPGPYTVGYECDGNGAHEILAGGHVIAKVDYDKNADFIAHAREDIPALLDEVRRLRDVLAANGIREA